jgi:hypothetical protein
MVVARGNGEVCWEGCFGVQGKDGGIKRGIVVVGVGCGVVRVIVCEGGEKEVAGMGEEG